MTLYDSLHGVLVKLNTNEKNRQLRITVEVDRNSALGKAYRIRITDDEEPTFLYCVLIGEEDFNVIKTQQGLRADFESFPNHLIKKLDNCLSNEDQFYLILDDFDLEESQHSRSNVFIKIIERSDFKDTCLLRLRIAPGTEKDIRSLMCSKINLIRSKFDLKDRECNELCRANEKLKTQLDERQRTINELELRRSEEVQSLKADLEERLEYEKAQWIDDLKKTESHLKEQINELEKRIALLDFKNRGLNDEKRELEKTIGIRSMKLEMAEKDLSRCAETTNQLVNENTVLSEKVRDLKEKVASSLLLKKELEKDNETMARLIRDKDREMAALRENDRKLRVQIDHLEREKKNIKEEWRNANNNIDELKKEIVYANEKKKSLLEVAELLENQKEAVIEELDQQSKVVTNLERKLQIANIELQESQQKIAELEKVAAAHEKELQKQVDVNTFLHRKFSEKAATNGMNASAPEPSVDISRVQLSHAANRTLPPWLTASATSEKEDKGLEKLR